MAKGKSKTISERRHMGLVASLGCVVCRNMGYGESPAQLHHIRSRAGLGQRSSHTEVIPLCPAHHMASYPTGFHASPKRWQAEHGTEDELLAQVLSELESLQISIV